MANTMMLFPWPSDQSRPLHDEMLSYFREVGLAAPGPARGITTDELVEILDGLGWPFEVYAADDAWRAFYRERLGDGTWPPIQEVTWHEDRSLGFRLGHPYGPWRVSTQVVRLAGPHVALEYSGGEMCVVTADLGYEDFYRTLFGGPPAPSDRWPPAPENAPDRELSQHSRGPAPAGVR